MISHKIEKIKAKYINKEQLTLCFCAITCLSSVSNDVQVIGCPAGALVCPGRKIKAFRIGLVWVPKKCILNLKESDGYGNKDVGARDDYGWVEGAREKVGY